MSTVSYPRCAAAWTPDAAPILPATGSTPVGSDDSVIKTRSRFDSDSANGDHRSPPPDQLPPRPGTSDWKHDRSPQIARLRQPARRAMQAVQRKWNLARLRYRKQLQREFWIRRNELGIALACPQIRGSNGVSRGGSRGPPQVRWPGRCRPSPRRCGHWAPARYRSCCWAALRGEMKGSNDHVSRLDHCPNLDHLE